MGTIQQRRETLLDMSVNKILAPCMAKREGSKKLVSTGFYLL